MHGSNKIIKWIIRNSYKQQHKWYHKPREEQEQRTILKTISTIVIQYQNNWISGNTLLAKRLVVILIHADSDNQKYIPSWSFGCIWITKFI